MRIAAFQMVARAGDVPANLGLISQAAAEAKARGADLLVAPELATTGYGIGEAIRDLADTADGDQISTLAETAASREIAIVAGFAERAGGLIFNSAALVEPTGQRFVYRKCQLYGAYEKTIFTPGGSAPTVIGFAGVKIGLIICYDVEFPEITRRLALAGATLVLVPTALPQSEHSQFIAGKVVPVRAFENQIAIVYANHAGSDVRFTYAGRSCIVMPDGDDRARAGRSGATVLVADYEQGAYVRSRAANPYLGDRRTDLF
jgi:predicted amidohydrolase